MSEENKAPGADQEQKKPGDTIVIGRKTDAPPAQEPPVAQEPPAPAVEEATAPVEEAAAPVEEEAAAEEAAAPEPESAIPAKDISQQRYHLSILCNALKYYDELLTMEEELDKNDIGIKGTKTDQLYELRDNPLVNNAARFVLERILDKPGEKIEQQKLHRTKDWKCGNTVSGKSAVMAFTARTQGIYRLYLYNSGFYVDLRPCKVGELHTIFETIDMRAERLGSVLGEYQYFPYDVLFKEAIMEVLPAIVVNSNLKGYDRGRTLARAVSIHDYDPIVWALSSMLVDRKLEVNVECLACNHHHEKSLDFGRFHLLRSIPPAALQFIHEDTEIDKDGLKKYQELLGYGDRHIDYLQQRVHLRVPSLFDVVDNSKKILAELEASMTDEPTYYNIQTINGLLMRTNNNFVPWIEAIGLIDEEDPTKETTRTPDAKEFANILNINGLGSDHAKLQEPLLEYMAETKASVIGYVPVACPSCGDTLKTESGFVPWDPERVFFETTYQTLDRDGILITE